MWTGTRSDWTNQPRERAVRVPIEGLTLDADLYIPDHPRGVVIFAEGSRSNRRSPSNRLVAGELQRAGFATIIPDLLTPYEERQDARTGRFRFDVDLLAARLGAVTDWAICEPALWSLPIGYFGGSTGAAAGIIAAARHPGVVCATVSRGGRPDFASRALTRIRCPTLLIVGEDDIPILELNHGAVWKIGGHRVLQVVPHATHLIEEPGAPERVASLARTWFDQHLARRRESAQQGAW
jgi:pimeloyl-ACP methyl ester carboxylesterase